MKIQARVHHVTIKEPYDAGRTADSFREYAAKFRDLDFIELNTWESQAEIESEWSRRVLSKEAATILNEDQILQLAIRNIEFKVESSTNVTLDVSKQLVELAEKPIRLLSEGDGGVNHNHHVEVHMPNHAMAFYNEVMLLGDACSDNLQMQLTNGWRILAACPQPDQRRPDYILARFNPDVEAPIDARRGN
tara:strand:+ start:16538 stop:17110 length:573 start_codon:yes stop_codon:yes gene_type:complete